MILPMQPLESNTLDNGTFETATESSFLYAVEGKLDCAKTVILNYNYNFLTIELTSFFVSFLLSINSREKFELYN